MNSQADALRALAVRLRMFAPHTQTVQDELHEIAMQLDPGYVDPIAYLMPNGEQSTVEQEAVRLQLEEIAAGVLNEWMRLVDIQATAGHTWQGRMKWQDDGTVNLTDLDHELFDRYVIRVGFERLPELPPMGPENDPAQIEEMKAFDPVESLRQTAEDDREIAIGDALASTSEPCSVCGSTDPQHSALHGFRPWRIIEPGDLVKSKAGAWLEVVQNNRAGFNSYEVVVRKPGQESVSGVMLKGSEETAEVIRGEQGLAVDLIEAGFPGTEKL